MPRPVAGAIIVCSVTSAPFVAMTGVLHDGTTIVETRVMLSDTMFRDTRQASDTVCHELMHAATGIKDRYGRHPKTSCVWGSLPSLGRFDMAYARRVYESSQLGACCQTASVMEAAGACQDVRHVPTDLAPAAGANCRASQGWMYRWYPTAERTISSPTRARPKVNPSDPANTSNASLET